MRLKFLVPFILIASMCMGQTSSGGSTMSQNGVPVLQITNAAPPPTGTTGNPYVFQFTATGGTGTKHFSFLDSPPAGITIDDLTGLATGVLGAAGNYTWRLRVQDEGSPVQTVTQTYNMVVSDLIVGSTPSLPTSFANPRECDGTTTNTIAFPADGLGMHGGTPYANTQAGVNQAIADANTRRDSNGSGTTIRLPHGTTYSGAAALQLFGSATTTGNNSTNCIVVDSDTPPVQSQTVCSHGVRESDRDPGCSGDSANLWRWEQSSTANQFAVSCPAGAAGPTHHFVVRGGEIRFSASSPVGTNGIAVFQCGTNAETSEAQLPRHMHIQQNYIHAYDVPDISARRGIYFAMLDSSIDFNYIEAIHGNGQEGGAIITHQSSRVLIDHNWIEGGGKGIGIGGDAPGIAGYIPSDIVIRGNISTRDDDDLAISSCVSHVAQWFVRDRLDISNGQRILVDGNILAKSWCDAGTGFIASFAPRACSITGCTGGNSATVSDLTVTNNIFAHAARGIFFDAASDGNNTCVGTGCAGYGQTEKGRRWKFKNNLLYDIGDFTRFPGQNSFTSFTTSAIQVGSSGQVLTCALSRDVAGVLATATCTPQGNVVAVGMITGDPVKLTGCTPDAGFNVGNAAVGPPVITVAGLTFTFGNTGASGGTATCTLDNSVGAPQFTTFDHNSIFMASNSVGLFVSEHRSPAFQYPRSNSFTNNIFASNGGGAFQSTGKTEGTQSEQLFDTSSFHLNSNVLTGRASGSYTTYQAGELPNLFPGNGSGGNSNQSGVVCPGATPTSGCLGVTGLMNGVVYNSNPPDYHSLGLRSDSFFFAGAGGDASDGLSQGADLDKIDGAIDSLLFLCDTSCGTGPFPDSQGVFMVASGGDNVHNCVISHPCDDLDVARVAVQSLPPGAKAIFFHEGTYTVLETIELSGNQPEDMLDWWLGSPTFRTTNHLTGPSLYNAGWLDADGHKFWEIKNSSGHPWDINLYDDTTVYLWITELAGHFNDSNAYGRFLTPLPLTPRYFYPGSVVTRESAGPSGATNPTIHTLACETDSPTPSFLGSSLGVTTGPTSIAWGGGVGTAQTIRVDYYYSGNAGVYHNRERYWLVKGFGSVQWDHATCAGNTCTAGSAAWANAVPDNVSTKVTVTAGAAPSPSWTCGTAFPWWVGGTPGVGGNVASGSGTKPLADSGTSAADPVLWRNYPGEAVTITGRQRLTGFTNAGSCGTNCTKWTLTLPTYTYKPFEALYFNGVRRPRPQARGTVDGYFANACPTSTNNDPDLCVSGGVSHDATVANTQCGCPAGVLANGGSCVGLQTRVCTIGGATPFQCFNKYKYNGTDINGTWHGMAVGDVELLIMETWDMPRMRLQSASGGVALLTGATAQTNDHGCQGGHHFIVENVLENAAKGQWYLDRDANNDGLLNENMTLNFYADTSLGENPNTGSVEVPQLAPTSPELVEATGISYMTFQGLTLTGDNYQPPFTGLPDTQGQPLVEQLLLLKNVHHLLFDTVEIKNTQGWGFDFQASSHHNTVQHSHCEDIGGGCVRFGTSQLNGVAGSASDTNNNVPQFNTVQDNLMDYLGRYQPSGYGTGIFLGDGHHHLFTHNRILYPYTGCIELGFYLKRGADDGSFTQQGFIYANTVSFNYCEGAPNALLTDFGGVYSAPSFSTLCPGGTPLTGNPCNAITDNVFKNLYHNYRLTASAASSGARGIYCDQGCTNMLIRHNLVVRAGHSGFFLNEPQHTAPNQFLTQNNLVDENIFAYCGYVNATFSAPGGEGCYGKLGTNASSVTIQKNILYMNNSQNIMHPQVLPQEWACFLDDGVTPTPCVNRFLLRNNVYWNKSGTTHTLQFATCKSTTDGAATLCASPFNGTNYHQFSANGMIPAAWTNAWTSDNNNAGEDNGSTAADPVFANPTWPTDDYHYSASFAAQGINAFDYTQAGTTDNHFSVSAVPDMFPVRPVNPTVDFEGSATNTHYIRAGAGGTGTSWTDACSDFTGSCAVASLVRGDTYYVAAGSYAGRNFSTATSGSLTITIKRATITDHGTSTGWLDAYDGQVIWGASGWFAGNGGGVAIEFSTANWIFDGATHPTIGAVGNDVDDWGWKLAQPSSGGFSCSSSHVSYLWNADKNNITVRNTAINSCGPAFDVEQMCFDNGQSSGVTYEYNFGSNCQNTLKLWHTTSSTVQFNDFRNQWSSGAHHGESVNNFGTDLIVFRWNYLNGCAGTACFAANDGGTPIGINHAAIYGNIFVNGNGGNGVIGGVAQTIANTVVYNNTFVDSNFWFKDGDGASAPGNILRNNLIFSGNCGVDLLSGDPIDKDYNSCFQGTSPLAAETHGQTSGIDPFVDSAGQNFQLLTDTSAWFALASPYDVDSTGFTRTTSRGALQKH